MATGPCSRCGLEVPLHAARPRVTADGRVVVTCDPCARGDRPPSLVVAVEPAPIEPPAPRRRRAAMGVVTVGVAALAIVTMVGASPRGPGGARPAAAGVTHADWAETGVPEGDSLGEVAELGGEVDAPADPAPVAPAPPIPTRDGEPLDEFMPTLRDWVHPVPDSPEIIPTKGTRVFGAEREGTKRTECGKGHCGVDLEGVRGQAVVAVAWGTVSRIQRDPDRRGGRYVRIEHPDFVYTSYFHLDAIAPDLAIGQEVEPGTPLGTLGRSGIRVSMPHLHFALELMDGDRLQFVDPLPYLARARVLSRDDVPALRVPDHQDEDDAAADAGGDADEAVGTDE